MRPQPMLAKAISLVASAFEEKLDRGGQPMVLHCLTVMNKMDSDDEELRCAAVLHDFCEETGTDPEELSKLGFTRRIISAVALLTHDPAIDYETYIRRLSINEDARRIKRADLEHNSCITRLKGLRKIDHERMEKYHRAYVYLSK